MKSLIITVSVASLFAASVQGRVGENLKEVEARYGKPQKILDERANFRWVGYGFRGFMVGVAYVNCISQREGFARPDLPELSETDVQGILALSAGPAMTWKAVPLTGEGSARFWARSDRRVIAMLNGGNFLTVQAKDFHAPE